MRKVIDLRRPLGSVPIEDIKLNAKSRDDVPAILIGLQAIYKDKATREELFRLLDAHVLPDRRRDTGRPGMDFWSIIVMGVLKQGLNCDYDRLQDLANEHGSIRKMLGHADFDDSAYELQTIRDNVELMTPELLREVSRLVVLKGHKVLGKKPGAALVGRCDSFVAETNVHYPTDFNLLLDSALCLIRGTARACGAFGIGGWRQHRHLACKIASLHRRVGTAQQRKSRKDEVRAYLKASLAVADKAADSLAALRKTKCPLGVLDEIERLLKYARRFADQIRRRVIKGEKIPHKEKVFSIHEEHTRWISKGKAGTPVELGVPVCILEDGNGFVLGHGIMWKDGDTDVAVPLAERCQAAFPDLRGCSFDRGFHSQENRRRLDAIFDVSALPKKGRLSASEKAREAEPAFAAARRKHSGVESAINNIEHRGLDRVRLRGPDGFELAVGLSVLSLNIHRLGMILRDKERKRLERQRKKMRDERKRLERQRERTQRERGPPHRCQRLRAA